MNSYVKNIQYEMQIFCCHLSHQRNLEVPALHFHFILTYLQKAYFKQWDTKATVVRCRGDLIADL